MVNLDDSQNPKGCLRVCIVVSELIQGECMRILDASIFHHWSKALGGSIQGDSILIFFVRML